MVNCCTTRVVPAAFGAATIVTGVTICPSHVSRNPRALPLTVPVCAAVMVSRAEKVYVRPLSSVGVWIWQKLSLLPYRLLATASE